MGSPPPPCHPPRAAGVGETSLAFMVRVQSFWKENQSWALPRSRWGLLGAGFHSWVLNSGPTELPPSPARCSASRRHHFLFWKIGRITFVLRVNGHSWGKEKRSCVQKLDRISPSLLCLVLGPPLQPQTPAFCLPEPVGKHLPPTSPGSGPGLGSTRPRAKLEAAGEGGGVRQPIIKMPAGGGGVHSGRGKLVGEGHCRGVREEATTGPLRWVWGGPHCADDRRLVSWHQSGLRTWAPALTLAAPSPSRPQPIPQLPPPPRNPALG